MKNFYDLDLTVEYDDFSFADRHLFHILDYFFYQERMYSFKLYDLPFGDSGKFSITLFQRCILRMLIFIRYFACRYLKTKD